MDGFVTSFKLFNVLRGVLDLRDQTNVMAETLALILVFLIIAVGLDGLRRMRNARRSQIKLSRRARKADRQFGVVGAQSFDDSTEECNPGEKDALPELTQEPYLGKPRVRARSAAQEQPIGTSNSPSDVQAFHSEDERIGLRDNTSYNSSIASQQSVFSMESDDTHSPIPAANQPVEQKARRDLATHNVKHELQQKEDLAAFDNDAKSLCAENASVPLLIEPNDISDTISGISAGLDAQQDAFPELLDDQAAEVEVELDPLFSTIPGYEALASASTTSESDILDATDTIDDCEEADKTIDVSSLYKTAGKEKIDQSDLAAITASRADRVVDAAADEACLNGSDTADSEPNDGNKLSSLANRLANPFKEVVSKTRGKISSETAEIHAGNFRSGSSIDQLPEKQEAVSRKVAVAPEEMIVLHVMAKNRGPFTGEELKDEFKSCGLRYGDMQIFHAYDDEEQSLFSVASAVVPGTFKLNAMKDFSTPGISFFMGLPNPGPSLRSFDCLIHFAQLIAERLGGELMDEMRNPMRKQTIEHYRQRICDYERQQRLAHA